MKLTKISVLILLKELIIPLYLVVSAGHNDLASRSAYFITRENQQLEGYVAERFESPSLLSCCHSCLRNAWCTSTNFEASTKKNGNGMCELNKHNISLVNEDTIFSDQQGSSFSMLRKVTDFQINLFPQLLYFFGFESYTKLMLIMSLRVVCGITTVATLRLAKMRCIFSVKEWTYGTTTIPLDLFCAL